ncbi:alpha-glucosidase/alpha-galactosidase [Paenibacillus macerans]|uniref:family 4 glycosyl hydrolase n=1 Tax=Paenibacillus macerans TaxID=44252 RepID=UPI003D31A423
MHEASTIKNLKIAYIGGGSRGWAWGLMSDLALEPALSGNVALYDIDFAAAQANEVIGNRLQDHPEAVSRWQYEAVRTLPEALKGADFVIISILPGTFEEMRSDVHAPEAYGVYQSVGDTVGPGGAIRALRSIPMYVEIAEAIRDHSPNAWVINYTNPMSVLTRTLYEVFPGIKAFGCCHEVFGTQELLAEMLQDMEGLSDVRRQDIEVNVLGINHFTWLDRASYRGTDLFPVYRAFAEKYAEEGFSGHGQKDHWMNNSFTSANRIHFDLFRRFNLIAAAGDRHLAEFMPNTWYLRSPEHVKQWKFGLTPVSWRIDNLQKLRERSRRLVAGEETFSLKSSGEEGIAMLRSLTGASAPMVTNVNLPNRGQMASLPRNAVVETNAVFGADSVQPVLAGGLPEDINNLVTRHVYNQEAILKAALAKDRSLAFRAFLNDPLLSGLTPDQTEELFATMLNNTKAYLPGWEL